MSFELEQGYIPVSFEAIMEDLRVYSNTQFGTTYTTENFVGTNFYKYYYAAAQKIQQGEIKTSEIFQKLKEYIVITNQAIARPVATFQGIIDRFAAEGYVASVKAPADADAGKVFICVDVDNTDPDYADIKLELCTIIKDSVSLGMVTQGTESSTIVLTNGQGFDFKYDLPDRHTTLLRLTVTTSDNNQMLIGDPDVTKATLLANIAADYSLGKDFEPQRYFSIADAPWASQVLLEYSINAGANWYSVIYEANYDDLLEVSLADTTLIEN